MINNVLSLFDGISCGQLALIKSNVRFDNYFSSEIDKSSIIVTQKHFPNTIQLGDITKLDISILPKIDLLIGGSPCQDFSIANVNRIGLEGVNGKLFHYFVNIKNKINAKYFLYENVTKMKKSDEEYITKQLGVKPIKINSLLVSAQNRERYYWTNLEFNFSKKYDNVIIKDIIENLDISSNIKIEDVIFDKKDKKINELKCNRIGYILNLNRGNRVYDINGKSITLTKNGGGKGRNTGLYKVNDYIRRLTPLECERLQCLPDNYTDILNNTNRYSVTGNCWTVDIISNFFNSIN